MKEYGFERRTRLEGVRREDLWAAITSWEGVNHELAPVVRMTHPARISTIADIPADGRVHFTSILLLLGWIPIDAHRLALRECVSQQRFDERSSNLFMKRWHHHRSLVRDGNAIEVRDRCRFEARLPFLGAILAKIYGAVFTHRHARLRARFGPHGTRNAGPR